MFDVCTDDDGKEVRTDGLHRIGQKELKACVSDKSLAVGLSNFIGFVARYASQSHLISDGQTVSYGFWMTKFKYEGGFLVAYEYSPERDDYVCGVDFSVAAWEEQQACCLAFGSSFSPPLADRFVAISNGLLDGEVVSGVRYKAPEHMSGWYLTTGSYDGNVKSLKVVHLYHIVNQRRDLIRYLALAPGYRFDSGTRSVRFDAKVAQQ